MVNTIVKFTSICSRQYLKGFYFTFVTIYLPSLCTKRGGASILVQTLYSDIKYWSSHSTSFWTLIDTCNLYVYIFYIRLWPKLNPVCFVLNWINCILLLVCYFVCNLSYLLFLHPTIVAVNRISFVKIYR